MFSPDVCSPGEFSTTTLVPCNKCEIGTYQDQYKSSTCQACAEDLSTATEGAASSTECRGKVTPQEGARYHTTTGRYI